MVMQVTGLVGVSGEPHTDILLSLQGSSLSQSVQQGGWGPS